jgi:hypothetical protein
MKEHAIPKLDPPLAIVVSRVLVVELRWRLLLDKRLEGSYLAGDDEVERESLRAACALVGVEPQQYRLALATDGNLLQLHESALVEAICGTTDPGPYDQIAYVAV